MGKLVKMPDSNVDMKKKNKKTVHIIVILLLVLIGIVIIWHVCSGGIQNISLGSFKTNTLKSTKEISLNSQTNNYFAAYQDSFINVTPDAITFYGKNGEEESSLPVNMSDPIVSVCGDYIAVASRGSKDVDIFQNKKFIYKTTTDQNITHVVMNKSGSFILVTEDEYYKNKLSLRNVKGEELFAWLSADGYITSTDLSNNGKNIAVGTLNTKNGYYSEFFSFNIYDKTPVFHKKYPNQMLIGSAILDNGNYLALFDNQYIVLNDSGEEQKDFTYPANNTLKYFDYEKGGHLSLLLNDDVENSHILLTNLNQSTSEPTNLTIKSEITALCASKNAVFAASPDQIYHIGWDGSTQKAITLNEYGIGHLICLTNQTLLAVRNTSVSVIPF